jgi:stage III sporulation protein AG
MRKKLSDLKSDKNFIRIIFIIGIAGILLIFCSTFFDSSSKASSTITSVSEYQETEQERIEEIIEQIQGVGRAKVMLTMENSSEQVYSDDTIIKEIEPVVRGVVIACDGADNSTVKENVLELVTKAFNISSDKVCIIKLKEE